MILKQLCAYLSIITLKPLTYAVVLGIILIQGFIATYQHFSRLTSSAIKYSDIVKGKGGGGGAYLWGAIAQLVDEYIV